MPTVSIEPVDYLRLDTLDVDTLVLPLFEAVEQPRGAAGHLDWRLCGRLGRMLRDGVFNGTADELMLMSFHERVPSERIFLFGLGSPGERASKRCHKDMAAILPVIDDAGAQQVAFGPPADQAVALVEGWLSSAAFKKARFEHLRLLDAEGTLDDAMKRIKAALPDVRWAEP